MIGLDSLRNVFLTDKIRTEEHETVGWAGNIPLRAMFTRWVGVVVKVVIERADRRAST